MMAIRRLAPERAALNLGSSSSSSSGGAGNDPYFVGQQVRLTAEFFDEEDELADPSEVVIQVIDGNGKQTNHLPSKLEVGIYQNLITVSCSGTWRYRGVGTGALIAAGQKTFDVLPNPFT